LGEQFEFPFAERVEERVQLMPPGDIPRVPAHPRHPARATSAAPPRIRATAHAAHPPRPPGNRGIRKGERGDRVKDPHQCFLSFDLNLQAEFLSALICTPPVHS